MRAVSPVATCWVVHTPLSHNEHLLTKLPQVDVKDGAGPASSLFINEAVPVPAVQPGEVLVRVKAFGINRGDILQRDGKYPGIGHLSKIMGLEFSGIIAELREDEPVGEWKVGDEVFGLLYGGGYAEYVNVNKRMLIRKPKELSFDQTGGLCEVHTP